MQKILHKFPSCAVLVLCFLILSAKGSPDDNEESRAHFFKDSKNNLFLAAERDRNVTLRLMGEAATVMINDVDMLTLLRRRQRIVADRQAAATREPLSLDVVKDQFRDVKRRFSKIERRVSNARNSTRRSGLNQSLLRRQLQRVERVSGILRTIAANLAKDECQSSPCKNGGICHDAYNGFQCECTAAWQGPTCEEDVNECFTLAGTDLAGCLNNGQCINTPGGYRCVCRNGFSGAHCRLRQNSCFGSGSKELCGEHGTCIQTGSAAGYVCVCDQGWTWADANMTSPSASPCTRDVDECAPSVNPCHDLCINLPGSYRCGPCPTGYTGDGRFCRDVDECAGEDNGGCSLEPRVACINTEGSHRCGRCPPGWRGDGRSCTADNSNSCDQEDICHPLAKCEMISGTVVCTCPLGTFGHGYGADGCTKDPSRQPCDQHPCQNNGTCVQSGMGTTCICQPGYTGALCNSSDICHPSPCLNGGSCRLLPGNLYQCHCPAGFTGTRCAHSRFFCGSTIRGPMGQLHFPQNSAETEYQADERCPFIIRTTQGQVLNLTFTQFELQNSTDCSADFLQLHDGHSIASRMIGRFCGSGLPLGNGKVITTQEQAFFWFRSDNETQGKGFHVIWNSLPFSCGEILSNLTLGQTGILRSPGYPGQARSGLDCRWQLTSPFGTRLLLRFYDITLGSSDAAAVNCSQDSVTVYDSDRQLLRACKSAKPEPLHSTSNSVLLELHTDELRSDSSFQVHYEVVAGQPGCGGVFTEPRGRISGHMNNEVCLYLIEQPEHTQVKLVLDQVDLLQSESCRLQKIEIFDGNSTDSPLMQRICGRPEASELVPLISQGNKVLVRYEYALSGLALKKSFELSYSRVCSGTFDGPEGIIETPNYPRYLGDMTCTYNITGNDGVIRMNILDLSLGTAIDGQETNYLDVYLGRDEKRHIVKSTENLSLVSHYNRASLVFRGSSSGRGMRLEYRFVAPTGCEGFLNVPGKLYLKRLRSTICEWYIDYPGRKRISVSHFLVSGNIEIYDNSTSPGILLNSYTTGFTDDFDGDLLTVKLIRGRPMGMFMIKFDIIQTECGGTFTNIFGYIKSPNWPLQYGESQNCEWFIRAPLGHRLELVVKNFTLEDPLDDDGDCRTDWLEIRNGDSESSPLIGRYCGSRIPPRIPSYGNAMHLKFHSDDSIERPGFLLTYQQIGAGCGGRLTSQNGAIHSPHLVAGNRGVLACDWQIVVAEGSRVRLQLVSNDQRLCLGQLSIFDGPNTASSPLVLHCNGTGAQPLLSTGNRVLVRYDVSSAYPDGTDFVLNYQTDCHVRLDKWQGAIETPNFPENYPPMANCEWDIRAGGRTNHLRLVFSHFALEAPRSSYCIFDHVTLQDMQDDQVLSEQKLCTNQGIAPITSVGNRLLLRFKSDSSDQEQGFRAEYQRIGCGEHLYATGGRLESPKAPFSIDMDCDWIITVTVGMQVRLLLHELHFEGTQGECGPSDVLSVSAPAGFNSSVELYRSCREETQTQTFTSPGNELRVRFVGSSVRARKYFRASYVQVPANCGGFMASSSGILTSPGFHNVPDSSNVFNFTTNVECVWTVQVSESYGIRLWFEQVNLTDSVNCSVSFVELTKLEADGTERFLERACGDGPPLIRMVHGPKLRVRFKAQAGSWGRFAMHYERQCGGPVAAGEGYLRSRLDEECSWLVTVPTGSKLSLRINHLDCSKDDALDSQNSTNGVQILNDDDQVLLTKLCPEHLANFLVSASNVRILTKGVLLEAQYGNLENTCGGNITSTYGSLASPNYPDSYPSNVECVWRVKTRPGNALEVNFEALDIVHSEHCNEDYLELRSGVLGPLLGLYCSKEKPDSPLIVTSELWIKFRSNPGITAAGFKLRWSYVHNMEITMKSNGTIESPPLVNGDEQPFTWRIFTEREKVLVLQFEEYISGLTVSWSINIVIEILNRNLFQLFDGYDDNALAVSIESSPWTFTSSSNVIYLKTLNAELSSFRLTWQALGSNIVEGNKTLTTRECTKVYTMAPGSREVVRTEGYPFGYPPNLNCQWTFKPEDPSQHISTLMYAADLEDFPECAADYVRMQTSPDLSHWTEELKICKKGHLQPRIHGTPNLRIEFRSDVSLNRTGFQAVLHTECGSNMTGKVGTIPMQARFVDCVWHIEVRPGRKIDISIEYANAGGDQLPCPYYGIIYDGLDDHAPLLDHGKFCNRRGFQKRSFRTSSSHAYVKYVASSAARVLPSDLWSLTYREFSDCDGEIKLTQEAPSFVITSPGYPHLPHPYADCTWLVIAPPGETVAANSEDPLALSRRHCDKEYVEFYDGSTTMSTFLKRTCRNLQNTLRSSGNLLLVHYTSQLSEPHGGFRLNVSLSTCGGQFSAYSDSISSEHYPALGGYPKPSECVYRIQMPKDTYIELNITDLHLPYDPNGTSSKSTSDRLEILDMANAERELMILDGSTVTPMIVTLNTNDAAIRFVAIQNVNNFRGFKLQYKRSVGTCSREVNGASGNIEISPMAPSTWLRFCRWSINVPKGQRVRLKLLNLADLRLSTSNNTARTLRERSRLTNMPHFSFYNDANSLSKITEFRIDSYNGSSLFESTDNFMLVTVMSNQLDFSATALKARYSSNDPTICPPNIGSQASGSLSIQSLAQLAGYYCSVHFVSTPGTTLTFKVAEYLFQTIGGPAVVFRDDVLSAPQVPMYANVTNSYVSVSATSGRVTILKSQFVKLQRFRATYRRHNCGGSFEASEGLVIPSPDLLTFIDDDYGELECLWTLRRSHGYVIEGNLTLTDSCDREYLVIFSGTKEVARLCRGMTMNGTLLERVFTKILYHANRRVLRQKTSFTLQMRRPMSSGSVIRLGQRPSPPITIQSSDYVNNMERIWEFGAREGLSQRLQFQDRFFIETSPNCSNDRLTVERYDRATASFVEVTSLCGRQAPGEILIPSSRMRVIFRTNSNVTGDGFSFTVSPSCDVTLQAGVNQQTIGSSTWEAARGLKLNCSYVFLSSGDQQLAVSVKTNGRPWTEFICSKSYFEAYRRGAQDQEESLGRFCPEFEVNGRGRVRLQFVSTASRWFQLHYQLIGCGGNHSEPFSLRPPQDDEASGRYAHNLRCQWRVTAPPQHAIVLEFKYFDMERSQTCSFDSLTIYRGSTATQEQMQQQLCGNQTAPPTIMVDSNEALIVLSTDSSNSQRGFLASVRFTPNCNEQVSLDQSVPRMNLMRAFRINASEPLLCHFRANVPTDSRLSVELRKLQLNDASCRNCSYLEIRDSKAVESQSLGRFIALGSNRTKVFSSYSDMLIQLSATSTLSRNLSFELVLQMETTVCGLTEYDMSLNESISLGLKYENATKGYEGSIHCTWTVRAEEDVEIELKDLNLPEVSQQTGKCEDYLRVAKIFSFLMSYTQDFCGHYNQSYKMIKDLRIRDKLELTFHSSSFNEFTGFEVVLRRKPSKYFWALLLGNIVLFFNFVLACHRTYTDLSQIIETDSLANCTEYIRVPEGYSITLQILTVLFESADRNYFNVTDLKTNKTIFTTRNTQWETVGRITTTNELRLDSVGVGTLKFFYFSTSNQFPSGCGGDLAVHGSMGSHVGNPPYEGRNSSLCSWNVSVPPGGNLRFSFSGGKKRNNYFLNQREFINLFPAFAVFDMGSENNCNLDNIRFYTVTPVEVKPVKTVCGSTRPDDFTIAYNNVIIVAKKSANFNGLGFQMDINLVES
ncbi:hypothetical protein KR054_007352 [Drosophila jambulina]|nr:hypothetical protein KR054_007352 [Drosophila jambulina]